MLFVHALDRARQRLRGLLRHLLCPELVHASEYGRVLKLKNVPKTEISHCLVLGKSTPITLKNMTRNYKPKKLLTTFP